MERRTYDQALAGFIEFGWVTVCEQVIEPITNHAGHWRIQKLEKKGGMASASL